MGITASDSGGKNFDPVPEGMHRAICYAVYDLGTHFDEKWGKDKHEVVIIWELPEERIDIEKDGETKNLPRAISRRLTLSLHEKSVLRPLLESWRGKSFTPAELQAFDITKLLGVNCMLQVIHNTNGDKTYANISTIVPLYKTMEKAEPENPIRFFSFEDDMDIPDGTPEWISNIIVEAKEMQDEPSPDNNEPPPYDDGDIPF